MEFAVGTAERYRFYRQYLGRVQACLGDWIQDQFAPGMFVAIIEPGSYLDFARPIPFADSNGVLD